MIRPPMAVAAATAALAVLLGCTAAPAADAAPEPADPSVAPIVAESVTPSGDRRVLARDLRIPWSMLRLFDESTLVSERGTAVVRRILANGRVQRVGEVPHVHPGGEGGLLGLAVWSGVKNRWLYAYTTAKKENRVVRMRLVRRDGGRLALGDPQTVLAGIAKNSNHNGGRIKFGPDDLLYVTSGDAGVPSRAQNPESLNGKILRITRTGGIPEDNPFPGSPVYSMGHRNPQGIAWDDDGQLWAAEFGQNTWDEFNRIEPGGNYGWPEVEGAGGESEGFIDPVATWPTSQASPSGLTYASGTFFLAALRGQRIWAITVDPETGDASTTAWLTGDYGRIRDVTPGPGDTLWFLTSNTDGRGSPRSHDDRMIEVGLEPVLGSS